VLHYKLLNVFTKAQSAPSQLKLQTEVFYSSNLLTALSSLTTQVHIGYHLRRCLHGSNPELLSFPLIGVVGYSGLKPL
jgi:hypothetical protein